MVTNVISDLTSYFRLTICLETSLSHAFCFINYVLPDTPSLAEEKAAAALGLAVMEEYGGMWRYFVTQWRGTKFVAPYHAQIGIRDMI